MSMYLLIRYQLWLKGAIAVATVAFIIHSMATPVPGIGIAVPAELPRKKGSIRLDPRPAREILSDEQKETIYHRCKQEFELLGYEP